MIYLHDYHHQWLFLLVASLFLFSVFWMRPRFGFWAASFLFYAACSSLYVWVFRDNRYVTVEPYDQMALRYFASDSLGKLLIVILPLMLLARRKYLFYELGLVVIFLFTVANMWTILFKAIFYGCKTGHSCGGIVGNPSISVSLLVCTLPLLIRDKGQWPWLLLASVAVFVSKSSIGIGLLAAYACLWFFPWGMAWRKMVMVLTGLTAGVAGLFSLSYVYVGPDFFHTSDRLTIWRTMLFAWFNPGNLGFGTGLGTYHVFSINLQKHFHVAEKMHWNWMHNNWLTFLFEMGFVGLILSLVVYTVAQRNLIKRGDKPAAVALALYALFMFMNPALNQAWPALFGAWIFLYALRRDSLQCPLITA